VKTKAVRFCDFSSLNKLPKEYAVIMDMSVIPIIFGVFAGIIVITAIVRIFCLRRLGYNRSVVVYSVVTDAPAQGAYYNQQQQYGQPAYGQPAYGQPPVYAQPPQQVYGNAAYQQPAFPPPPPPPGAQQSIY
jgi:hypothetical protein